MKHLLMFVFALFVVSTSVSFAQIGTTQTTTTTVGGGGSDAASGQEVYGEPIPAKVKTMPLSQAYPMASSLIDRKIMLTGIVANYCNHECWINLNEGEFTVPVHTGLEGLPSHLAGAEVALYGWFENAATADGEISYRFNAISVRP